ncbi:NAD(P)-dependent dehydrogenase, short-chain alcohol dehydrogenase family [Thalassovita litoralis]|jgi:NAD(P)-dependent dehydrogenase (short-subunit alcohol dehydrogenase family)|uniref:NAD(P)-dependent dehydrogenase, short-chain alcohol dehydrogenase family n=1 Tax=Thalassovita litoralis TaxID=1010611 RepID=A0A521ENL5_9RHOB|nr:SDR family NAD(P)-dependent oxidoreductase [Thalassovita litoralis]SMO85503.1 NAD(P)-dependent dehydrogenase, short-chain alcohol dehydrogenase family [Thalassovita litoralis]
MSEQLLAGKVAIVTGAGRGVGREIALLMAKKGAKVVVNDLGGGAGGDGGDQGPAADVVKEIKAMGGEAVANFDSVADFKKAGWMVEQAMDELGGIDIVVNNAGILRDTIFHKMTEEEFDIVIDVHLKGSFNVSRHAATQFRKQESGRMIHMTSTSGLIGNFGQANYAAAKLGIAGLSRSIALDMARYNVTSNCIGPFAWSRLIGTIPVTNEAEAKRVERMKQMTPAKIAPLVTALASDQAQHVSGQIFVARGGEVFLMSQPRPVRGMARPEGWTPETILEHAIPAFSPNLTPLERSGDVFCWDPI